MSQAASSRLPSGTSGRTLSQISTRRDVTQLEAEEQQIINNNYFDIDVILMKIDKLEQQYAEELAVLKERGNLQEIKYDLQKQEDLQNALEPQTEAIQEMFLERIERTKAEFEAKSENKYNLAETREVAQHVDQTVVEEVEQLRSEISQKTEQLKREFEREKELNKEKAMIQEQIVLLRDRQEQHSLKVFDEMKERMAQSMLKYKMKAEMQANLSHSRSGAELSNRPPVRLGNLSSLSHNETSVEGATNRHNSIALTETENTTYQKLHEECNKEIAATRRECKYLVERIKEFQAWVLDLRARIERITLQQNIKATGHGFLEYVDISDDAVDKFLRQLSDDGCLELLLQLCLLEDVAYNVGQSGVSRQRVGLEARSEGLEKRFDIIYDI